MGDYIVILGAELSKKEQEHSILDTKERAIIRLTIVDDELKNMTGYIACHWKDNQIIILGQKKNAQGIRTTHLGWLTIPTIHPGTKS